MEEVNNLLDPSSRLGWRGTLPVHREALIDELFASQEIHHVTYFRLLGLSESSVPSLTCLRHSSSMLLRALNTSWVRARLGEEDLLYWD
jgi:hypothetical protein